MPAVVRYREPVRARLWVAALVMATIAPAQAAAQTFRLSVTNRWENSGVVTSSPEGINCSPATASNFTGSGTCSVSFPAGTVVTLSATPGTQNTFGGWTGACTGTGSCQVTLDQNRSVSVTFIPTRYAVTLQGAGNGSQHVFEPTGQALGSPPLACSVVRGVVASSCATTQFPYGRVLRLSHDAITILGLNRWNGITCSTASGPVPCDTPITGPMTVVASVDAPEFQVRSGNAGGSGTVTSTGGNTTVNCAISDAGASGACGDIYDKKDGSLITFTATPAAGSKFVGWSGACSGSGTCVIMPAMPPNVPVVVANFALEQTVPSQYAVTIVSNGSKGAGRITAFASDPGIPRLDCQITATTTSGVCTAQYPAGSVVHLQTTPNNGSVFTAFSAPCVSSNDCSAPVVDKAITIGGTFQFSTQTVTVNASAGSGAGTVTSKPAGINCTMSNGTASNTCSAAFPYGIEISLSATPAPGSQFAGWQGACSGTGTCSLTMYDLRSVAARFERGSATLSVSGTGSGSIVSTPAGIACTLASGGSSGTCSVSLDAGTSVSLSATSAAGWTFAGWGGACSGTGACTVTLNANANVTAMFARTPVAITIAGAGSGNGLVTTSPGAARCVITNGSSAQSGCTVSVEQNTGLTLTADPQFGSTFGGWEGACSGTQLTCTITPSQATTVTARFLSPHAAHDVAMALLGATTLPADERAQLDRFGNNDGTFNLGDLLALLDRTGEKLTPATAAAIKALAQPSASVAPARRTP